MGSLLANVENHLWSKHIRSMDVNTDTSPLGTTVNTAQPHTTATSNDEGAVAGAGAGADIAEPKRCQPDDDSDSDASETSTLAYSHTPFEEFQPRVKELCETLWPHSSVEIERMRGGGYNRIIGLTIHPLNQRPMPRKLKHALSRLRHPRRKHRQIDQAKKFILRIPRYLSARIDHESAQTTFVRNTTSIPAPEVFTADLTTQNVLDERYTIQHRMPGTNLDHICEGLTHDQKRILARRLGQAIADLQKNRYPCPGQLDPVSGANILDFQLDSKVDPPQPRPSAEPQTGLEMIHRRFDDWIARYYDCKDLVPHEELKILATELNEETGFLASKEHFLCHLDLQPRNILVDASDPSTIKITGILDWDEAIFAPRVVGCEPPLWLWRLDDCKTMEEEDLQRTAGDTPTEPHAKQIREIFDHAVGPEYVKLAYSQESNIARRLCGWAVNGDFAHKQWEVEAARKLVNDWERSHGRPVKFEIENFADGLPR